MGQQQQRQPRQERRRCHWRVEGERRRCHLKNKKAGGELGGRALPPPQMHGETISNSFFTLVARSSSTSVPVCLALSYDTFLVHSHMSLCLHCIGPSHRSFNRTPVAQLTLLVAHKACRMFLRCDGMLT